MLYYAGRTFQLIGLLAMPSSMWVAEFQRNEALSIGMFVGSGVVFLIGWMMVGFAKR